MSTELKQIIRVHEELDQINAKVIDLLTDQVDELKDAYELTKTMVEDLQDDLEDAYELTKTMVEDLQDDLEDMTRRKNKYLTEYNLMEDERDHYKRQVESFAKHNLSMTVLKTDCDH